MIGLRKTATIICLVAMVLQVRSAVEAQTPKTRTQISDNDVKFQVGYGRTLPVGLAQKWLKAISEAGADGVRLVMDPDAKVQLTTDKFKSQTTINVFARINKRHDLEVSGNVFALGNDKKLREWIQQLKKSAPSSPDSQKGAFGLTNQELVAVYESLGKPYPDSTRGKTVSEVVRTIRRHLGVKIGADETALAALKDDEVKETATIVPEELAGLSCGTVMAAVIRPLGLVLVVGEKGKSFAIVDSRGSAEHWPIGWPIQKRPSQVAPILYKQTEVEIEGFALADVLKAIEAKTEIPFVFDQNTMARHGIELDKVQVNIGRTKTYYDKIIRLCLNEATPKLKSELRADEAGQPFLWISK